jgi:hypothetical protein
MKNRNKIINLCVLLFSFIAFAQIKIGDNPTNIGISSLLELESTNKALLITRVVNTSSIISPVNGMLVYDLSANCIKGYQNGVWTECLGLTTSELVLIQIGNEGDTGNTVPSVVTVAQINTISPAITGAVIANQAAYQAYIDANPALFSVPATATEVQNMVNAVNAAQSVLVQVGNEGDSPNTVPSVVTTTQLASVPGVTGVVPANQVAYQAYIDANPSLFSAPATVAEINAMIVAVNAAQSILVQVGNEGDSPNTVPSVVTTTQLASVPGVTGVVPANQAAYQAYIDANPSLFSAPATVAEVNAMIIAVNAAQSVLVQVGNEGDSPNTVASVVTATQLASVPGVTGVVPANQAAYQAYIDANPSLFSAPATVAEVNAMIVAVNAAQTSGGTALVSAYSCSTASAGSMTAGTAVSGVTQTITATVTTMGTYSITTTANGVTFAASGTFAGTGAQNIVLSATGTPTTAGSNNFTLNTTPNCSFSRTTNVAYTVPATITLAQNKTYMIASVYDQDYLPYTAPTGAATTATAVVANGANEAITVNIQGSITTGGVTIRIPVTATGSSTLPAFSQTINIPAGMTEDGISRDVTLSWAAQAYTAATTTINATIAAVGGTLNAKKLDINAGIGNDGLGILMGQFTYPYNNAGATTTYSVRFIAGIPDRNIADANHRMLYFPVLGADGNVWLNNNLGADYSNTAKAAFNPAQQATSATDHLAYGSLLQWGRKADGHELVTWTNATSGTAVNGTTTTLNNNPTNALYILPANPPYNWRITQDDTLWATEVSANNPCPIGFRVPSRTENNKLIAAAGITSSVTAFSSSLKFTLNGYRYGGISLSGSYGWYWTSSVNGNRSVHRRFEAGATEDNDTYPSNGLAVRCIKD